MAEHRHDFKVDVTTALPAAGGKVEVAATLIADPALVPPRPLVVVGVPGGTYHRRYWDMRPPGRPGYSMAAWLAARGAVFVACDYLGGGDSSRPEDGDFMTLTACADAAHAVYLRVRAELDAGTLSAQLPALAGATYVGAGQSLGGFVTMVQQGRHADYSAVAIFGASPLVIELPGYERRYDGMTAAEVRRAVAAESARLSGTEELPAYHGVPRDSVAGIFYAPDVAADAGLRAYDEERCHTVVSRAAGIDAMVPGAGSREAARITSPVFLAFGDTDVSPDPHAEPAAYPASRDVTLVTVPGMGHMHNFAGTREVLWERFYRWLLAARQAAVPDLAAA